MVGMTRFSVPKSPLSTSQTDGSADDASGAYTQWRGRPLSSVPATGEWRGASTKAWRAVERLLPSPQTQHHPKCSRPTPVTPNIPGKEALAKLQPALTSLQILFIYPGFVFPRVLLFVFSTIPFSTDLGNWGVKLDVLWT